MAPKPNQHIRDYLAYYFAFKQPPYYGVLIDGLWGIGKSYLIEDFLQDYFGKQKKGEQKYVYISLFGLSSIDEIDAALFQEVHPLLGSKGARIAGRIAKAVLKRVAVDPDLQAKDIIPKANIGVYVFDDLERCNMPINSVLGYINELIEHDGRKVVIIANEQEISEKDQYARRREKLIGKTLQVEPMLDEALTAFIAKTDDKDSKAFFSKKGAEITSLFAQSGTHNLRILQQTMWDFERLYNVLTENHRAHASAMTALLRLTFALSFEIKAGHISSEDLRGRQSALMRAIAALSKEKEVSAVDDINKRYPETDLSDSILSDEILIDTLGKGIYDGDAIRSSLDQSKYFAVPGAEPAWRTVWFGIERSDDDFDRALKVMSSQFEKRELVVPGEILQVLGLQLWLSELSIIKKSSAQVVVDARQYINDLYSAKRLVPFPINEWRSDSFDGFGGLRYHKGETAEFREVFQYLKDRRDQVGKDELPSHAAKLLDEMVTSPELFFRRLCVTNSDENIYARVPILAAIDPKAFVDLLLQQHSENQGTILKAFRSRYESGELQRELAPEKPWLEQVKKELLTASAKTTLIGKFRIEKLVEWNISPALESVR